jgi:anti-sigma factor RsiW
VTAALPALDPPAATALALVALAGLDRAAASARLEMSPEELAGALAVARKQLRREAYPLPGSGWCERAERMISDRLDDALEDPAPARLAAHLANCSRCVEHERRLVTVQDGLVLSFSESHPAPVAPAAPLSVAEPEARPALAEAEPVAALPAPEPAAGPPQPPEPVPIPAAAAPRTSAALAGGLAWGALAVLAVLLALASVGVAVAGLLGAG